MKPTEQDKELRALLDEFVLYTDSSPESNEPTELKLFLERCDFPDAIDRLYSELMELITADRERVALEARIDEIRMIETAQQNTDQWGGFCIDDTSDFLNYIDGRIAELKAKQEEVK